MKPLAVLALIVSLAGVADAAPRRYIVEFTHAPSMAREPRTAALREALPRMRVRHEFRRVLNGVAVELDESTRAEAVRALPFVARVTPDSEVVAYEALAGGIARTIDADVAANAGVGVVVAVIDSGIDYTHPALGGGFGPGFKVAGGWDFVNADADPIDDNRHGTHVAGIIAAAGPQMSGVAPEATLLAYKVLDQNNHGFTSDVIAAIEQALDPNGDGDTSDRADVINLSLGTAGNPDDPGALAVERAVAAGAVVVAATGNTGLFHRVGSPAAARSAIAVGATTGANLAEFSSSGPAAVSGEIKPDLLAPGTSIRSTIPGGGYGQLSGTSMAAPYVAGLAARLVEQHPNWTPARIKSALVASANPIFAVDVMAQGGGRASFASAVASDMGTSPSQLNFGNDGVDAASWESVRSVVLHNESNESRTISVEATGQRDGIALALPESFTLGPGESREIAFTLMVDNAIVTAPETASMSFGGHVALSWDGGALRLPWAFVRAARAVVTYPGAFAQVAWDLPADAVASLAPMGEGFELLAKPGDYGFVLIALSDGALRLIARDAVRVEGSLMLPFTDADTPHEIRLDTFPESATSETTLFSGWARLVTDASSFMLPMDGRSLFASDLGSWATLLLTEAVVDAEARTIRIAQHPPLEGIDAGRVLRALPADFATQEIVLHAPSGTPGRQLRIMPRETQRTPEPSSGIPPSLTIPFGASSWTGRLEMTRESHPDYAAGVQLSVRGEVDPEGISSYFTPIIRRDGGGFFASRSYARSSAPEGAVAGEAMEFGDGVVHPPISFTATPAQLLGAIELRGDRDELRRRETLSMRYSVVDRANGEQLGAGSVVYGMSSIPLARTGALHVALETDALSIGGRSGRGAMHLFFDTRRGAMELAAITSLAVLDGTGRHATRLPQNGNGSLVFSLQRAEAAGVFYRLRGRQTWTQLTPVAIGEDAERGTLYRVELADVLQLAGELEIRIEAIGAADTAVVWEVAPAFISEPPGPARRRRAVGR